MERKKDGGEGGADELDNDKDKGAVGEEREGVLVIKKFN